MKTFVYDHTPNVSELWDDCLYNLVYDPQKYVGDLEDLFKKLGVHKSSKILDSSAGSGFPALELKQKGYSVECMDFSEQAIEVFERKARQRNVNLRCNRLSWLEIPSFYPKDFFDFVFCRGNSFIYASGGWESKGILDSSSALRDYERTLHSFYGSMAPRAWIYVDKFKDNEKFSKKQVGLVKIANKTYEWYFYRNPIHQERVREAKMIFQNGEELLPIVDFKTYLLSFKELNGLMKKVGFRNIRKIRLPSEKDFDIMIAQK